MRRGERWLKTLPSLGDHRLMVAYARSELYRSSLGHLAEDLNLVCERSEQSHPLARDVLTAFVPLIADVAHLPRVHSIRATAIAAGMPSAGRLLRCSTPEGHLIDQPRDDMSQLVVQRQDGSPLSLGERRALARRPSRAALDRLLRDPHPMVVRLVLQNPRITEEDVVHMAARRPAVPDVVMEIGKLWSRYARVRRALALNPGSPPAVSVPMLSLMIRSELVDVTRAADIPAVVRAIAHDLRELRPPMDSVAPPELKH